MKATNASGGSSALGRAARLLPVGHDFALEGEAFGERAPDEPRFAVVAVIAALLAGRGDMQDMVEVVVPLRRVEHRLTAAADEALRLVVAVLQQEVDSPGKPRPDALRELVEDVGAAVVLDRVDGVEPEPVEMEGLDPVFGVLDDESAHRSGIRPVEIDRVAPRRAMAAGEEVRRVGREVIPLGAEMVVDDVEQHGDAAAVRGLDEGLEILRPAVARVGRVSVDAVVAPAPAAGKIADRHDLEGGDAEFGQVIELLDSGLERAPGGEGAEMQFIEDDVVPVATRPVVAPAIGGVIDDLARPVHVLRLEARGRIGDAFSVGELETIERPGASVCDEGLEEAGRAALHRHAPALVLEDDADALLRRRPETEANAARFERGTVRP